MQFFLTWLVAAGAVLLTAWLVPGLTIRAQWRR